MRVTAPFLLFLLAACPTDDKPVGDTSGAPDTGDTDPADSGPDSAVDSATDSGDTADSAADTGDSGVSVDTADSGVSVDTADTADTATAPPGKAVVLFIGDGMGFEHVEGGGMYATGSAGSLSMETLPYHGRLRTASLSGLTDSAASATAYASGYKTYNERLGLDGDGVAVESLLERARAAGMAVGVVTTDRLSGATPSAFVVHIEDRGDDDAIAEEYYLDLPDVALGGGYDAFASGISTASANVVTTSSDMFATVNDGRPLLGLFAATTFPFVVEGYSSDQPTLAEMTEVALDWLDADPDGFFLVVEGARIDHASHSNQQDFVYDEVLSFDDAVDAATSWAGSRDVTLVVTADHECGGLDVTGATAAGVIPASTWRWGQHTNADVPVFAMGSLASLLDGARLDQVWVHAVLAAAIDGSSAVTDPGVPSLVDGELSELGASVVTQTWSTSFTSGYNQLDALYLTSDEDGLRIGVAGVFDREANAVFALIDLDYGGGTGFGADITLGDIIGTQDSALSALSLDLDVSGAGFDMAFGTIAAREAQAEGPLDEAGLRGFNGDVGTATNFGWWAGVSNFDDGNVAFGGSSAPDAAATGLTEGGWEILVGWDEAFPTGIPTAGTTVAVSVVLVNEGGDYASNQALPPFASSTEAAEDPFTLIQVAALSIDSSGLPVGAASVVP